MWTQTAASRTPHQNAVADLADVCARLQEFTPIASPESFLCNKPWEPIDLPLSHVQRIIAEFARIKSKEEASQVKLPPNENDVDDPKHERDMNQLQVPVRVGRSNGVNTIEPESIPTQHSPTQPDPIPAHPNPNSF